LLFEYRFLRLEIQKLKEEKQMLIVQLVEMEQLRIENKQLIALLSQKKLE
jgi:cell shape-determining protein MreC